MQRKVASSSCLLFDRGCKECGFVADKEAMRDLERERALQELQVLIDEYCDIHLERTEWSPTPETLRWDFLSHRGERLRGKDWAARFEGVLARCGDCSSLQVNVPLETRSFTGPFGCGSWYWADSDAKVFGMLHAQGAVFPFPQFEDGGKRKSPDSDTFVRFFFFCPPDVAELVLADYGASLGDLEFTGVDVIALLKASGNAHAFRWLWDAQRECIDLDRFDLAELSDTPLFEVLIGGVPEGSVKDAAVLDAGVALAKCAIADGRYADALSIIRKLRLREAHVVDVLMALPMAGDVQTLHDYLCCEAQRLRARRFPDDGEFGLPVAWDSELAAEFLAFAQKGNTEALQQFMEGMGVRSLPGGASKGFSAADVPDEHVQLWNVCVKRLDVGLLSFLVAQGMCLPSVVAVGAREDEANTLVRSVANAFDGGMFDTERVRAFLLAALEAGVRFEGNGSREVMQVFCLFPGDEGLYGRLQAAGLSFHARDVEGEPEGSGDARVLGYLLSSFHKRVTSAWDSTAVLEDKKPNWSGVAYMLNHGAVLRVDSEFALCARRLLKSEPQKLIELAKGAPPQSIQPVSFVINVVAKQGRAGVLDVLKSWAPLLDDATLRDVIDACVECELTEATAYAMSLVGDSFVRNTPDLEL